jgi:hypothetical protein
MVAMVATAATDNGKIKMRRNKLKSIFLGLALIIIIVFSVYYFLGIEKESVIGSIEEEQIKATIIEIVEENSINEELTILNPGADKIDQINELCEAKYLRDSILYNRSLKCGDREVIYKAILDNDVSKCDQVESTEGKNMCNAMLSSNCAAYEGKERVFCDTFVSKDVNICLDSNSDEPESEKKCYRSATLIALYTHDINYCGEGEKRVRIPNLKDINSDQLEDEIDKWVEKITCEAILKEAINDYNTEIKKLEKEALSISNEVSIGAGQPSQEYELPLPEIDDQTPVLQ